MGVASRSPSLADPDPADVAATPVDVLPLPGVAARINPGLQVGVAQKWCKIFH